MTMINSKELMAQTGISRATMNNYIKLGILPAPVIGLQPVSKGQKGGRVGFFPEDVMARIKLVQQMKQEGKPMEEIAAAVREENGNCAPQAANKRIDTDFPAQHSSAEGLRLTIDHLESPAYLMNNNFEIEWVNKEAEDNILFQNIRSLSNVENRNIFKLFFGWELHGRIKNWQDLMAAHMRILKNTINRDVIPELYNGITANEEAVLASMFDQEKEEPQRHMYSTSVSIETIDGEYHSFELSAMFFREGVFFVYLPMERDSAMVMELLKRRGQVINELLSRRMPSLVNLCVLVADVQNSVRLCAELMPGEYFDLINDLWNQAGKIFDRYEAVHGKHAGDGVLYYFIKKPGSNYMEDVVNCAMELKESMLSFSHEWKKRQGWLNDLHLNIGINEGQEYFGAVRSLANIEFTALGDSINHAGRLSDFARQGSIWTTKNLIGKLDTAYLEKLQFGIRRIQDDGRELFVPRSFCRVIDVLDLNEQQNQKFADISTVPITEIVECIS